MSRAGEPAPIQNGLDPHNPSTFNDGILDGDRDADGDGLANKWELLFGYDPLNPDTDGNGVRDGNEDPDRDGLTNAQEQALRTNPMLADTDGAGWPDEAEVTAGSNPLSAASRPFVQVIAQPPVRVVLPALADPNLPPNLTLALPPVSVVLPGFSDPNLPANTTVAQPPGRGGVAVGLSLFRPARA